MNVEAKPYIQYEKERGLAMKMDTYEVNDFEHCIFCGKETKYKKESHISTRRDYIEGAGQLCPKCSKDIYNEKPLG